MASNLATGQESASATGAVAIRDKLLDITPLPGVVCDTIACFAMEIYWKWKRRPSEGDFKDAGNIDTDRRGNLRFLCTLMESPVANPRPKYKPQRPMFDVSQPKDLKDQRWLSNTWVRTKVANLRQGTGASQLFGPHASILESQFEALLDQMFSVGAVAKKVE